MMSKLFRPGLAGLLCLAGSLAAAAPERPHTVLVETQGAIPGFTDYELRTFIAAKMMEAGTPGWRFLPEAVGAKEAPDRVQWVFKPNPYAGGTMRHVGASGSENGPSFGMHRLMSTEVRLFLGGNYQTLAFGQATIQGGPADSDLAGWITKVTGQLLRDPGLDPPAAPAGHS